MNICKKIRDTFLYAKLTPPAELETLLTRIDELGNAESFNDVSCHELQIAVCRYLDTVALRQRLLGRAIGRTLAPPLADVVTEAMNIAVQALLESLGTVSANTQTYSEKSVVMPNDNGRNDRKKPDVSVCRGNELCFIVECCRQTDSAPLRHSESAPP